MAVDGVVFPSRAQELLKQSVDGDGTLTATESQQLRDAGVDAVAVEALSDGRVTAREQAILRARGANAQDFAVLRGLEGAARRGHRLAPRPRHNPGVVGLPSAELEKHIELRSKTAPNPPGWIPLHLTWRKGEPAAIAVPTPVW